MKVVRLFNIRWDTDDEDSSELGLPSETIAILKDNWTPIVDPRNWTTTLSRIPGRIGPVFGRKAWQRSGDGSRRR